MNTHSESPSFRHHHLKTIAECIRSTMRGVHQPKQRQAVLSIVIAVMLWSTSYVVTKMGVNDIPPLTFGAIRFLFAAGVAGLMALFILRVEPVPLKDLIRLAIGGFLGITAFFSLQNLGVQRTSASDATLLVASFPAITMLLEASFLKRQIAFMRLAGVGIAFIGVCLIIQHTATSAGAYQLKGNLILLASGLAWALYNFATQHVVQKYSTFTVIFWQTLAGALTFLPLSILEAETWQPPSVTGMMSALFLGVFCSIAAFMLYGYGLKRIDPGSAVSLMNLVPVFGLILANACLKEAVSFIQVLGGLIVIGGVTLSVQMTTKEQQLLDNNVSCVAQIMKGDDEND